MSRTFAIAWLLIRAAIRSRFVLSLLVILFACLVGLPMMLRGDGSAFGSIQVLLSYTLGAVGVVLGAATLWVGCGAVSQEIEERQLRLIAVKPVRKGQIWLGKWLGLVGLNIVFLLLTGLILLAGVSWRLRDDDLSDADRQKVTRNLLVARKGLALQPDDRLDAEVADVYRDLTAEGRVPEDMPEDEVREKLRKALRQQQAAVAPGADKQWTFAGPPRGRPPSAVQVRVWFTGMVSRRRAVHGTWFVGTDSATSPHSVRMEGVRDIMHQFSVPAEVVSPGQELRLRFVNDESPQGTTVIFRPQAAAEVLLTRGGFAGNLVRTLLVMLCHLAFLAALGLTAGSLFSFPVAAFVSVSLLLISLLGHYVGGHIHEGDAGHHRHGEVEEPRRLEEAMQQVATGIGGVVEGVARPHYELRPVPLLADGMLVSYGFLARAVGLLMGVYVAVLGAAGAWILRRRELALPQR